MESKFFIFHAILTILLIILQHFTTYCQATKPIIPMETNDYMEYINKSCDTTLYSQFCCQTLSRYADIIQANPKLLANTSLSVTLSAAKSTSMAMKRVSRYQRLSPGEAAAIHDCVDETDDSVFEVGRSMEQMRHMDDVGPNFVFEISNVQTWVSAALTDYDTCMDGFAKKSDGSIVKNVVHKYIENVSRLTSIALTFINNYALVG